MAVDPAMIMFDTADTVRNTLLNYVMSNRRLQQQARQFDISTKQKASQFDRVQDRYDESLAARRAEKQRIKSLTQGLAQQQKEMALERAEIAKIENNLNKGFLGRFINSYQDPVTGESFRASSTSEAAKRMQRSLKPAPSINPELISLLSSPQELSLLAPLMSNMEGGGQFVLQSVLNQELNRPYGGF
tara:strand:+ start:2244 stop:2807 length:564 start_codon:yes stop_codon:yes gene_type:complete